MDKYIINKNTLVIMPNGVKTTIIESYITYNINNTVYNILDESCKYYGSTLLGRIKSSKYLTGVSGKLPIIIYEKANLIFFPTASYRNEKCIWLNYNEIIEYYSIDKDHVSILLTNKERIIINLSNNVFSKQLFKASRLETILKRNYK